MKKININPTFKNLISPEQLTNLLSDVEKIAYRNTIKFQDYFPTAASDNGIYTYTNTFFDSWHGGWWTGIFYMIYMALGDERFRYYADSYSSRFYTVIRNNRIVHREMGFMFLPVCVYDININQNSEAAEAIIFAARYMAEAFGITGDKEISRGICSNHERKKIKSAAAGAINSNILRLAAGIGGNPAFGEIATEFARSCFNLNVSDEGKCLMNVFYNPENNTVERGFDDSSAYGFAKSGDYIRPYAWIALGLVIFYIQSNYDEYYEQKLYNVLNYFLNVSGGNLAMFVPGDEKGRNITDTTSLAIFVCALSEFIKKADTSHKHYDFYFSLLKESFNKMISYRITASSGKQGFLDKGILLGGYEIDGKKLKNGCNICGDYFYLEALMHMTDGFESCWNVDRLYNNKDDILYLKNLS